MLFRSGVRMVRDVGLDRLPVIFVVADALAVHADRQNLPQLGHLGECCLQLPQKPFALFFRLLAGRDVARYRVDQLVFVIRRGIPQQPSV